jgi:hypothetical protein
LLLGTTTDKDRRCGKARLFYSAIALVFLLMLIIACAVVPALSAAVKSEMAEWRRVHHEMEVDIGQLLEKRRVVLDDLEQLKLQRDQQRQEWEREREENEKRRRGHVPFWGEASLITAQCPEDGIRRYDARMHNLLVEDNWNAACMNTPMNIPGHTFASPHSCLHHVRPMHIENESFLT